MRQTLIVEESVLFVLGSGGNIFLTDNSSQFCSYQPLPGLSDVDTGTDATGISWSVFCFCEMFFTCVRVFDIFCVCQVLSG